MRLDFRHLIGPVHELMTLYQAPIEPGEYPAILEAIVTQGHLVAALRMGFLTDEEIGKKLIVDLERCIMIREKMTGNPRLDWNTKFANGENEELYQRLIEALFQTLKEAEE